MKKSRRWAKPWLSLVVVSSMLAAFSVTASAEEGIPYVARSWDSVTETVASETRYVKEYTVMTEDTETLSGWVIVNSSISVEDRLEVNGTANLILCDDAYLYCEDGIHVSGGNVLNIYAQENGSGKLYCDADTNYNAAIGSDDEEESGCGTIEIHGGVIIADTNDLGTDGAGIGGGNESRGGQITIYGGSVTAIGGDYGAGIGSGDEGTDSGTITIYGGTVDATGGTDGAGLGGGNESHAAAVTIWGGTVTAQGGSDAAGIGGGDEGNGGSTVIYGGEVTATGGARGAGIGGGDSDGDGGLGGQTTIYGGTVNATGGTDGAGIGAGEGGIGGVVEINGGMVTATGGELAAGIGSGESTGMDGGDAGTVIINGGQVTATGGNHGAGIGGGDGGNGAVTTINGGTVIAEGKSTGSGIGVGRGGDANDTTINGGEVTAIAHGANPCIGGGLVSKKTTISITGGTVTARLDNESQETAAIGSSSYNMNGKIIISGGTVYATAFTGAAIGAGYNKNMNGSITISGGTVWAYSGVGNSSGAAIGTGRRKGTSVGSLAKKVLSRLMGGGGGSSSSGGAGTGTISIIGGTVEASVTSSSAEAVGSGTGGDSSGMTIIVGDNMKVRSGSIQSKAELQKSADRVEGCQMQYAKVDPCTEHDFRVAPVSDGEETHSLHCAFCGFTDEEHTSIHDIEATSWTWADDRKSATVNLACMTCGFSKEIMAEASQIEEEISDTRSGECVITASVTFNDVEYTDSWVVYKPCYVDLHGDVQQTDTIGKLEADTKELASGWYVVADDLTNNNRILCNGDINLILCDGVTFDNPKGITVSEGSSLTIWEQTAGSGKLNITSPDAGCAGIGGALTNSGQITINGGIITVWGGDAPDGDAQAGAAGIGGGQHGSGRVTINGGDISAHGGPGAAGIGNGGSYAVNESGPAGDSRAEVIINGGNVKAEGGDNGAGIGSGAGSKNETVVTINGGYVSAVGKGYAADIGGGRDSKGTVVINGGSITTLLGGIGSGQGDSPRGSITLGYGDAGTYIFHLGYQNTEITLTKPFTDGKETFEAKAYGSEDEQRLKGKTVYSPGLVIIDWKDTDGTVLETDGVMPGQTPVFNKRIPVKAADSNYTYSFVGWTPEVTAATENTAYTARFEAVPRVLLPAVPHGKVTSNVRSAKPGETVTLRLTPAAGCHLKDIQAYTIGNDRTPVPLTVPAEKGEKYRTFTMPDLPVVISAEFEHDPVFLGYNLSLGGDIGLLFYLDVTAEEAKNNVVNFNWSYFDGGELKNKSCSSELWKNEDGLYTAVCPVPAAEMIYGINASITLDGETFTDNYAVFRFADTILTGEPFAQSYIEYQDAMGRNGQERLGQLRALIKAMLDYGSCAQVHFDRAPELLVNSAFVTDDPSSPYYYVPEAVDADMIHTGSSDMYAVPEEYGLEYVGSTVVYLSRTSLRHYYRITDQAGFEMVKDRITFDGEKCGYTEKEGLIYFELTDISAPDLDTLFTLKIGSIEYKYSALDYVKECLSAEDTPDSMRALAAANYRYNKAANIFFEEAADEADAANAAADAGEEAVAAEAIAMVAAEAVAADIIMADGIADDVAGESTTFEDEYEMSLIPTDRKSIKTCTVSGIEEKTYTGRALIQDITVMDGETVLVEGTDYMVSYLNNKKVGTATVSITGIGDYRDTHAETFTISYPKTTIAAKLAKTLVRTAKLAKTLVRTAKLAKVLVKKVVYPEIKDSFLCYLNLK